MAERKRNLIYWTDLECTGSGDDEDILEIGAVITDRELNEIDHKNIVLPMEAGALERMSDVVVKMHTQNGLISDSMQRGFYTSDMQKQMELAAVDDELSTWVRNIVGSNNHIPIAGSGISHYDRKYIRRDLPKLDKRLTYYALDIGSVRRIVDLVGLQWPDMHTNKAHRALDDTRGHIEETRRFLAWCEKAKWKAGIKL